MAVVMSVDDDQRVQVPRGFARRLSALARRAAQISRRRYGDVAVALVGKTDIRKLNRIYRHHDRITDVLSFTYQANPVAGELIICLEQAASQAKRRQHTLARELEVLATHGLLHLAGHDHMKPKERKIMRALERRVLS